MKNFIVVLLLLFGPCTAAAAELRDTTLTLEECLEMSLKNNRQAAIARNEAESAVNLRREAFTKYFPEIFATGMAFWANHDIIQYNLLNIIELGIIKKGKAAGVQALQPIFLGGQIVNGNKLAQVGEEVGKLRMEQTDNELRLTTETLFWKLTTLQATRSTLETAIATLDSVENQVQVAVDAGIVTLNDLLKVKLKRNTYASELVDLDNGISLVRMLLCQYVGLNINDNLQIVSDVPEEVPTLPDGMYVDPANALSDNIDYQLLEMNVRAKRLEKRMELGKNLPSVAVGAGWYYHDLFEQNHNFGAIQIGVTVPISGWWGGAHALKRKSLALINAEFERDDLSEKLTIDIQDKWNNVTAAHRKMEIEAEGIGQSKENFRLNSMYYEAGISTISDLLEAETALKDSKEKYITAYGAYRTACAAYLHATGR